MRASAVTRHGFNVTCCEIVTKLRREFTARLCLVDVIMKSLSMRLASVDVEPSVRELNNRLLICYKKVTSLCTAVDRRRIQTTTCRDLILHEERTTNRHLCTVLFDIADHYHAMHEMYSSMFTAVIERYAL